MCRPTASDRRIRWLGNWIRLLFQTVRPTAAWEVPHTLSGIDKSNTLVQRRSGPACARGANWAASVEAPVREVLTLGGVTVLTGGR